MYAVKWNSPLISIDQSISVLRVVGWYKCIYFYLDFNIPKANSGELIRRRVLWCIIWVRTVSLCPTKRMLGVYMSNEFTS